MFACLSSGKILLRTPVTPVPVPLVCTGLQACVGAASRAGKVSIRHFSSLYEEGSAAREKLGGRWQVGRKSASGAWLRKHLPMLAPFSLQLETQDSRCWQMLPDQCTFCECCSVLVAHTPYFIPSFLPDSQPRFLFL